MYNLPLYYQTAKGYSPVIAGLASLPQALLSGPSTALTSTWIGRTHIIKPFSLVGWLLFAYGTATLNILSTETTVWGWIILNVPSGVGIGILFASLALSTQASAEFRADLPHMERMRVKAVAAALNPFFRAVGQAFGIAICQAAFSNELNKRLGSDIAGDAASFVEVIRQMPADDPDRATAVNAFVESLRVVWWILFAMSCLMIVLTLFTRDCGMKTEEEERLLQRHQPRSDDVAEAESGLMGYTEEPKPVHSRQGSMRRNSLPASDASSQESQRSSLIGEYQETVFSTANPSRGGVRVGVRNY